MCNSYQVAGLERGDYGPTSSSQSKTPVLRTWIPTASFKERNLKKGSYEIEADVREGKLVLSKWQWSFVYGVAVDEETLEASAVACKGF